MTQFKENESMNFCRFYFNRVFSSKFVCCNDGVPSPDEKNHEKKDLMKNEASLVIPGSGSILSSSWKLKTPSKRPFSDPNDHELDDFTHNDYDDNDAHLGPNRKGSKKYQMNENDKIFAEIISDRGLPMDIPPIKVLINKRVADSFADSIKDSHLLAHELSKSLLLEFFAKENTSSRHQFGTFLHDIFQNESILLPTRQLIYWSLTTPSVETSVYEFTKIQTCYWIKNYSPAIISDALTSWITYPITSKTIFVPSLVDLLRSEPYIINPSIDLATHYLPYSKVEKLLFLS
jgi:hypothetical protein